VRFSGIFFVVSRNPGRHARRIHHPARRSKKSSRPSLAEPPRIIPARPVDAEVKKDK
jgi:hypothetical protein